MPAVGMRVTPAGRPSGKMLCRAVVEFGPNGAPPNIFPLNHWPAGINIPLVRSVSELRKMVLGRHPAELGPLNVSPSGNEHLVLIDRRARVVGNAVVPHGPDVGAIHGVAAQRVGPIQGIVGGVQAVVVAGHPVDEPCRRAQLRTRKGESGRHPWRCRRSGCGEREAGRRRAARRSLLLRRAAAKGSEEVLELAPGEGEKAPYQRGLGGRCRGGACQRVQYPVDDARHQVGHDCQRILRRLGDRRLRCSTVENCAAIIGDTILGEAAARARASANTATGSAD